MKIAATILKKKSRAKIKQEELPESKPVADESHGEEFLPDDPDQSTDEIVSIEEFIEMKKRQNKVLEKIIETIHQSEKKV